MSKKYLQYKQAKAILAGLAFVVYSTSFILNEINYTKNNKQYHDITQLLLKEKELKKELKKNMTLSLENIDYARIKKESLEEKADSLTNEMQKYSCQEISETQKRNKDFLMNGVWTYALLLGYLIKSGAEISYFRKERYKELKEIRKTHE